MKVHAKEDERDDPASDERTQTGYTEREKEKGGDSSEMTQFVCSWRNWGEFSDMGAYLQVENRLGTSQCRRQLENLEKLRISGTEKL